jgi:hypothetical protein
MSKKEKLISRLLLKPKDFTWGELVTVLGYFGFEQMNADKTSGSRVRFTHERYPPITLHKPHPTVLLKKYQIEELVSFLKEEKLL